MVWVPYTMKVYELCIHDMGYVWNVWMNDKVDFTCYRIWTCMTPYLCMLAMNKVMEDVYVVGGIRVVLSVDEIMGSYLCIA